jgi:hypothetical protein
MRIAGDVVVQNAGTWKDLTAVKSSYLRIIYVLCFTLEC